MNPPLQVLIVEDSENDAALLELELQRAGYAPICQRVDTSEALGAALDGGKWDIVIADYVMPKFNGLAALDLVNAKGIDIPFIIVSGHVTDATAVAAMKAGAHDYVMKDNLARLGPAVRRELREAEERRARRRYEEKLKVEQAFREAVENSVPSGIAAVDLEGRQTYVNPAFCAMTGWSEAELIGTRPPFAYWPPEDIPALTEALGKVVRGDSPAGGLELRFRRRNGEHFDVLLQITPLRDSFGNVTGWVSSASDISELKRAQAELRRARDELETRVQQRTADLKTANARLRAAITERERLERELLEITEKERRRIGLDLHDDLGQKLAGIALMTKGLELRLSKQKAQEAGEAAKIHGLIQQAMNHASEVAHDLATLGADDKELPDALRELASRAHELYAIPCRFEAAGSIPPLKPNVATQLYKIAQEAVTNAVKHGKAKRVGIDLSNGSDRIVLTIQNTGLPFPDLNVKGTGMGLRIMNYRASVIGAALEIKGTHPDGTRVTCSLPVAEGAKG